MSSDARARWTQARATKLASASRRAHADLDAGNDAELEGSLVGYLGQLCAAFQRYTTELYTESVDEVLTHVTAEQTMRKVLHTGLVADLALNSGNPTLDNLRRDFGRLRIVVSGSLVVQAGPATGTDLEVLRAELLKARNKVLHGEQLALDTVVGRLNDVRVTPERIDAWAEALDRIVATVDGVVTQTWASWPIAPREEAQNDG